MKINRVHYFYSDNDLCLISPKYTTSVIGRDTAYKLKLKVVYYLYSIYPE